MWVKILLLFFVFSFLFRTDHAFDQDLGRHLKLGEIILKTGSVPKTNLFSYTNPDFPFINTHWLFEVVAFWFSQTLGLQSFLYLKVIIFLVSVLLILKIIPKENQALLLPVGFIFFHVLRERMELRPEILSFLLTALTYYILEKSPSRLLFLLPLIQLIWINTHIYFFIGLLLQIIFLIHSRTKKLGLIFILSVLVSLINPNGLAGFLYPLEVSKNYGYTIAENQTMFFLENINFQDPNFLFAKISLGIAALSIIVSLIRKKLNLKNILLLFFGLSLALLNVRGFPYLVFLALPVTLQNFGPIRPAVVTKLLVFFFVGLLIWESLFYLNGNYYKDRDLQHRIRLKLVEHVSKAMDFVLAQDLPGPIYNNFDIGSYIIYRAYPKYQVFVDGRPEAYPKEFFQNTYIPMQSDLSRFMTEEQKWGFQTIIFSHTDQTPWGQTFLLSIVKNEGWKIVYFDDFMLVLVKNEVLDQKKLTAINLSKLSPDSFEYDNHVSYLRMAIFLQNTKNLEASKKFIEKAAQIYPKSPIVNSVLTL